MAGVESRLELAKRNVELEYRCLPIRRIDLAGFHQRRLEGFHLAVKELNTGEQMNRIFQRRWFVFRVGSGRGGRLILCRIVDFVEEVKMLVRREDMRDI